MPRRFDLFVFGADIEDAINIGYWGAASQSDRLKIPRCADFPRRRSFGVTNSDIF